MCGSETSVKRKLECAQKVIVYVNSKKSHRKPILLNPLYDMKKKRGSYNGKVNIFCIHTPSGMVAFWGKDEIDVHFLAMTKPKHYVTEIDTFSMPKMNDRQVRVIMNKVGHLLSIFSSSIS